MGDHLQFTAEVVGEERREQIDLITNPGTGGNIIELIVGFKLGEDPLWLPRPWWKASALRALRRLLVRMTLNS